MWVYTQTGGSNHPSKGTSMTTNTIIFSSNNPSVEVLRLSKDGIWANPDVPADEAGKLVLEAIDYNIKVLVQKAVEDEREACAKVCDEMEEEAEGTECCKWPTPIDCAYVIRTRGQA